MNNKQSMKLYKENHLIRAIAFGFGVCHKEGRAPFNTEMIEFIESLNPIQLPSDKEIKKEMEYYKLDPFDLTYFEGISYMRDKIQGGNNE